MEAISELDANSRMGLDGKYPRLLKNLSAELSVPIKFLFNNYLVDGCLLKERKTSLSCTFTQKVYKIWRFEL